MRYEDNFDDNADNTSWNGDVRTHPWYDQIRSWYRDFLERDPTDEEVASHYGNPGGLDAIYSLIRETGRGTAWDTPPQARESGDPYSGDGTSGDGAGGSGGGGTTSAARRTAPALGSLLQPYGRTFSAPDLAAAWRAAVANLPPIPTFTAPSVPGLDPFQYPDYVSKPLPEPGAYVPEPFVGPTVADLTADPSYTFRLDQGRKALEAGAAAKGILRTGGTLKDLLEYGQNFGSQEFGNVFDRKYQTWNANETNRRNAFQGNFENQLAAEGNRRQDYLTGRDSALTKYKTNVDTSLGAWDREFNALKAEYEPQVLEWQTKARVGENAANNAYDRGYKEFQDDYSRWWQNQNDVFNRLKWQSEFDRDSAAM